MTTMALERKRGVAEVARRQLVTFQVGSMLLAIPVESIQEINRNLDVTLVPHAPRTVRGVVNLRGNVVTVMDLHALLGIASSERTRQSRNLIVQARGEAIGLWVDRILDTVHVAEDGIAPPPANLPGVDQRLFDGVFPLQADVALIIRLTELLAAA